MVIAASPAARSSSRRRTSEPVTISTRRAPGSTATSTVCGGLVAERAVQLQARSPGCRPRGCRRRPRRAAATAAAPAGSPGRRPAAAARRTRHQRALAPPPPVGRGRRAHRGVGVVGAVEPDRRGPPAETRPVARPARHRRRRHEDRDDDEEAGRQHDEPQQRLEDAEPGPGVVAVVRRASWRAPARPWPAASPRRMAHDRDGGKSADGHGQHGTRCRGPSRAAPRTAAGQSPRRAAIDTRSSSSTGRPLAVGERQPPVGVLVVGARLVHGPPVADHVGQRDAEQPARCRGERAVQRDGHGLARPRARRRPASPRSTSRSSHDARSASSTAPLLLDRAGEQAERRRGSRMCSPAR